MEPSTYRLPKLSNIMAFETAAKTGSLAGAADILCLTPAAVSQQIRQLEDHLGVKLFLRSKHGVELTEAGTSYLAFTQEAFETLRTGQQSLARYQGEQALTITALPTLASRWLMPRLYQWMAAHPHIQLRVQATHSQIDFGTDPTDFYLSFGDEHYAAQHCVELFRDRVMAVCSPALLPGGRGPVAFEQVADRPMIHIDWGRDGRFLPDWSEWLLAAGHTASPARSGPSFNLSSMAIDAALAGQGLLLGQRAFVHDDLRQGRLVALSTLTLPLNKAYYLVYPERVLKKPGARELMEWLCEQAAQEC
ncbi:LysR substrate-binding domain-containing protein [Oceanimonas marisflavi]|uniref:LysR substrate-binding domain-containing protein n=1 Tax=Oceanimonas marisflavi TaxID=2059724 RepID=UPI000D2FDDFE|nr:LysR substrate-binding domain-containing protein [Oceanimonas marisflavi]